MITPKPHIPEIEGMNSVNQNGGYVTVNGCRDTNHYTNILKEGKCDKCGRVFGYDIDEDGENAKPLTKREQKNAEEVQESLDYDINTCHNV